jgi:hypothetical protein
MAAINGPDVGDIIELSCQLGGRADDLTDLTSSPSAAVP